MRELLRSNPVPSAGALAATAPSMWPELDRDSADRHVRSLAGALTRYGLDPGKRVAVIAPPTPEALVALAAACACGARAALVDPGIEAAPLTRILRDSRVAFVLAGGESTLRRVVDLRPDLESVELILALVAPPADGRPLPALPLSAVLETAEPARLEAADDPGFEIVARDGSTRAWPAAELARRLGELAGGLAIGPQDTVLVRLETRDPHWAPGVAAALARQARVILDSPDAGRLEPALALHKPTVVFVPAREMSACRASWEAEVLERSFFRRKMHGWALEKGSRAETRPWVRGLADRLVLAAYRERLGGKIRRIVLTGGSVDPGTARFLSAVGLPAEAVRE